MTKSKIIRDSEAVIKVIDDGLQAIKKCKERIEKAVETFKESIEDIKEDSDGEETNK